MTTATDITAVITAINTVETDLGTTSEWVYITLRKMKAELYRIKRGFN